MADSTQSCSRCSSSIEKPITQNSNYVSHSDFDEEVEQDVHIGLFHTEETLEKLDRLDEELEHQDRQAIAAESAHPEADVKIEVPDGTEVVENEGGTVETASTKEIEYSIPVEDFEKREIPSPNEVQDNDQLALVVTQKEPRPVRKTAVVCPGCTKDDDEIIWGVDN